MCTTLKHSYRRWSDRDLRHECLVLPTDLQWAALLSSVWSTSRYCNVAQGYFLAKCVCMCLYVFMFACVFVCSGVFLFARARARVCVCVCVCVCVAWFVCQLQEEHIRSLNSSMCVCVCCREAKVNLYKIIMIDNDGGQTNCGGLGGTQATQALGHDSQHERDTGQRRRCPPANSI